MSAAALPAGPSPARLVAASPVRSVVPALAAQEARRLMLHPLTLLGFGFYLVATVSTGLQDQGPRAAFETTSMVLTFYPGVLLILVGNLLATRDHRAGSEEMLDPAPGRREERVLALALASLAPAVVGLGFQLAWHAYSLVTDRYGEASEAVPGVWHLLSGPVTLTGACLFGLMLGVWSRARLAALVGLIALVAANVWVDAREDLRLLGPALGWARWGDDSTRWAGVIPGSPGWHLAYLVALCALAFSAAWLRVAARRTPVVVLGLLSLSAVVGAGLLQMPGGAR